MAYTFFNLPDAATVPEELAVVLDGDHAYAVLSFGGSWKMLGDLGMTAAPSWLPVFAGHAPIFHADFENGRYWFQGKAFDDWPAFASATGASGTAVFGSGLVLDGVNDPTWSTGSQPFAGWSQEQGTFLVDYEQTNPPGTTEVIVSADDGSTTLKRVTFFSANAGQEQLSITVSIPGHTTARSMIVGPAGLGRRKVAFSYRDNCVIGARGETLNRNVSPGEYEPFGITKLWLGRRGASGGNPTSGAILKSITYFNAALGSKDIAAYAGRQFTADGGIWTWFNDPRALKIDGDTVLAGGMTGDGRSIAKELDIQSKAFGAPRYLLDLSTDDHTNPGFALTRNGVIALHTSHNGNSYMLQRRGANGNWSAPEDIGPQLASSWYAYANPVVMESGRIYNFLRAAPMPTWSMHMTTSADDGETWSPVVKVLTGDRPYFKVRKTGPERIDFICNDAHPGGHPTNSTYHFWLDTAEEKWRSTDGTDLGALPFTPATDLNVVHGTGIGKTWVWDVMLHGGKPVACFAAWPISNNDHRYHQSRWDGANWIDNEVCAAGGPLYAGQANYSGGVITDPEDDSIVYCSRQVDSSGDPVASGGTFQLFRYCTTDGGSTWEGHQLTFGRDHCFRPFIPEGSRLLLFNRATRYVTYQDYDGETGVIDIAAF